MLLALLGCPDCRAAVYAGVFNDAFYSRLLLGLVPFGVIGAVAAWVHRGAR